MDVAKDMRLGHGPEIVIEQDTFYVIHAYAPYVRLEEYFKVKFKENLKDLLQDTTLRKDLSRRRAKWACRKCIENVLRACIRSMVLRR